MEITSLNQKVWINQDYILFNVFSDWSQIMAMAAGVQVQAEVEEEENFGPQPLCRLEVCPSPKSRYYTILIAIGLWLILISY